MRLFTKFFILLTFSLAANAHSGLPKLPHAQPKVPAISGSAYLLMDFDSKQILAQKNTDIQLEPASLTKMMTVYVIDNELRSGRLKLDDKVTISKKAWQAPGSRMFVNVNSEVPVSELLKGIIIQSGNDASIALAEHIAGSEEAFAELMNAYADILGMQDTHFVNASGLPNPEHVTTAYDLSLLAHAIIKNFPETYRIYSEKEFIFNGIKQQNRNRLLWRDDKYDGIKTGFTDSAGYCIVASGSEPNMRLIAIVMGTQSDAARTEEANKLLAWGFRFFETNLVFKAGSKIQQARVWMGADKEIDIGVAEDLYVTTPKGQYNQCSGTVHLVNPLTAPLQGNEIIGTYVIQSHTNDVIHEQPVVSLESVKQGNILQRSRDFVMQKYNSVLNGIST